MRAKRYDWLHFTALRFDGWIMNVWEARKGVGKRNWYGEGGEALGLERNSVEACFLQQWSFLSLVWSGLVWLRGPWYLAQQLVLSVTVHNLARSFKEKMMFNRQYPLHDCHSSITRLSSSLDGETLQWTQLFSTKSGMYRRLDSKSKPIFILSKAPPRIRLKIIFPSLHDIIWSQSYPRRHNLKRNNWRQVIISRQPHIIPRCTPSPYILQRQNLSRPPIPGCSI